MAETKRMLIKESTQQWQSRWDSRPGMKTSKLFMPKVSDEERNEVIACDNKSITLLASITTGHGLFAQHLAKWTSINDTCVNSAKKIESPPSTFGRTAQHSSSKGARWGGQRVRNISQKFCTSLKARKSRGFSKPTQTGWKLTKQEQEVKRTPVKTINDVEGKRSSLTTCRA